MDVRGRLRIPLRIAIRIFILCIPLLFLTASLGLAVNDLRLYEYGHVKYDAAERTGFSDDELMDVARGLVHYFNTGEAGEALDIFDERDMIHLEDVRELIRLCYILLWAALAYSAVFITAGAIWQRRRFTETLARTVTAGCVLTGVLIALVFVAAAINFRWMFVAFHRVFFEGDSWILEGYLPQIYTSGFFFDAFIFVAAAILIEAAVIGSIAGFYLLRRRRRRISGDT